MQTSTMQFSTLLFCVVLTFCGLEVGAGAQTTENASEDPPGHMQPIGSHRPPEGPIDSIDYAPDPVWFYENYVKPGKPLLLKGQAKKIPAFNLWTDDYLSDKFGETPVAVEIGKKENRSEGTLDVRLKAFISAYKRKGIYLVQDLTKPMQYDFHLLKPLLCGGFTKVLSTAVMWFSSGGTKSVLHNDNIDNINCIFEGSKDFLLIDKAYQEQIEGHNFEHSKGYSKVDVEKVDMYEYSNLALPWYSARMEKGDCFFIPVSWYHHVHSFGDVTRNLAVNIWFSHLYSFNYTDCADKDKLPETQPLSDFKFASKHNPNRDVLLEVFRESGVETWDHDAFADALQVFNPLLTDDDVNAIFKFVDANEDGQVTWEELQWFDIDEAVEKFGKLFEEPGADEDDAGDDGASVEVEGESEDHDEL